MSILVAEKEDILTLTQVTQKFKSWMDRNVSQRRFWITCEVAKPPRNGRHYYMELVDSNNGEVSSKIQAVIWYSTIGRIESNMREFGVSLSEILKTGNKVLLYICITYHEIHGLKLSIENIDPSVTLGDVEKQKKVILERLKKEGLLDLQKSLQIPALPKRIAIIGSPETNGLNDFLVELTKNNVFRNFVFKVFPTSVQGDKAISEIVKSIQEATTYDIDVMVIVRGGGSKMDLHVFNHYEVCKAIAYSRVPVITGIGHEKDHTLADDVSNHSEKTPTAVAKFLYLNIGSFFVSLNQTTEKIVNVTKHLISETRREYDFYTNALNRSVVKIINVSRLGLEAIMQEAFKNIQSFLSDYQKNLDATNNQVYRQIMKEIDASRLQLLDTNNNLRLAAMVVLKEKSSSLLLLHWNIYSSASEYVSLSVSDLNQVWDIAVTRVRHVLDHTNLTLKHSIEKIAIIDPTRLFEKGYTISTINGVDLNEFDGDISGKEMTTYSDQLEVKSTITQVKKR